MKKIIYFILTCFLIICTISSVNISKIERKCITGDIEYANNDTNSSWKIIDFNYLSSKVYFGYILENGEYTSYVSIPQKTIEFENIKPYYVGRLIQKGECIDNYTFEENLRVYEIKDNEITFDCLEKTTFYFYCDDKIASNSNFTGKLRYYNNYYECSYNSISYNKEKNKYMITFNLENDGYFVDGMKGKFSCQRKIKLDDNYYVLNDYIYYDDNDKPYILKFGYIESGNEEYYKKIYINVIENYGSYSAISGEIANGNIILQRV